VRVIGLIGGMSWESSAQYYRLINESVKARLGTLHSARSLMYTVDFAEIEALQHEGRWDEAADILVDAARRLERGGADCLVLCTNTMHKLAERLEAATPLPLLHIADCTGECIKAAGLKRVGLLATAFTMEEDFYKGRLAEKYGLSVLIPEPKDRKLVHRVIYDELCQGRVVEGSRADYVRIMRELAERGAEGIILGCTEIMLLVGQNDAPVPVFDTTTLHAEAAVAFALAEEGRYVQATH
jgi:aspartate racemase